MAKKVVRKKTNVKKTKGNASKAKRSSAKKTKSSSNILTPVKRKAIKVKPIPSDPTLLLKEAAQELGAVDPDQLPQILARFKKEVSEMERVLKD